MQLQNAKPSLGRPIPNRRDPLWHHCIFACAVASLRGFRNPTTGDLDDVTGKRAQIFTTGGFTPNNVNYQRWHGGYGWDNGDGVTSLCPEGWDGTAQDYYAIPQAGFTAAVIIRPDAFSTNGQLPFFKRGPQPYGNTEPGWRFTGAAGNLWRFNFSDGVTARTVTSTTTQDANFNRADLLVARVNAANTSCQLWVNGKLEATSTFAATPVGNPAATEDIKVDGYDPTNGTFPGWVPFGAVWPFPLADSQLNRLNSDPFIMWRHLASPETLLGAPAARSASPLMAQARVGGANPVIGLPGSPGGLVDGGCCCCAASAVMF